MVIQNISGQPLLIVELEKIVPADGKCYILPENIAFKYKDYLKPIQRSDHPPTPTLVSQQKYNATIVEIDLDSLIAEEFEPYKLDEDILDEIKVITPKENEKINNINKPLSGKKIKSTKRKTLQEDLTAKKKTKKR